jgi:di/tricarboxylate transporter
LHGLTWFQARLGPLLLSLFLSWFLSWFLALLRTRRLGNIAAIARRRRHARGKLVGERGQIVALARLCRVRTARHVIVRRIRPYTGPRSAIGVGLQWP